MVSSFTGSGSYNHLFQQNFVTVNHPVQYQHRLSEVYLKPFGYRYQRQWYISVLDMQKNHTEQMLISEFTAGPNIFDYELLEDMEERRHFEKLCARIESQYGGILKSVRKGQISSQQHLTICEFMATLVVRSERKRDFFSGLSADHRTRQKFFDEITFLNEDLRSDLDLINQGLSGEEAIKLIATVAGEHLAKCLAQFEYVILKAPSTDGKKWFTSDNPVIIHETENFGSIISAESEIYFPVSKDYCFFFYHTNSDITDHPLRTLPPRMVHECDPVSHGYIHVLIQRNIDRYLLIPMRMDQQFEPKSRTQQVITLGESYHEPKWY